MDINNQHKFHPKIHLFRLNQRKIVPMDSERLAKVVAIKKEHDLTGPVPYDIRLKIKDL